MVYPRGRAAMPWNKCVLETLERFGKEAAVNARRTNRSIFEVWEGGISNFNRSPSIFVLPY